MAMQDIIVTYMFESSFMTIDTNTLSEKQSPI